LVACNFAFPPMLQEYWSHEDQNACGTLSPERVWNSNAVVVNSRRHNNAERDSSRQAQAHDALALSERCPQHKLHAETNFTGKNPFWQRTNLLGKLLAGPFPCKRTFKMR